MCFIPYQFQSVRIEGRQLGRVEEGEPGRADMEHAQRGRTDGKQVARFLDIKIE